MQPEPRRSFGVDAACTGNGDYAVARREQHGAESFMAREGESESSRLPGPRPQARIKTSVALMRS